MTRNSTPRRRTRVWAAVAASCALACAVVHSSVRSGTGVTRQPGVAKTLGLARLWPAQAPAPPDASTFPFDCSPAPANTSALMAGLTAGTPQPGPAFPAWMDAVCPEVVEHFAAFPYFTSTHATIPVMTTVQAAHVVCTVKIISDMGAAVGTDVMLYDGSLIGALRHGGPVPWDDDADLAMSFAGGAAFLEKCKAMESAVHPDITVHCQRHSVFIKVHVRDKCSGGASMDCTTISTPTPKHAWRWPYADIFLYRTTATQWQESEDDGSQSPRDHAYPLATVFPVQRYYFGGLTMPGPRPAYADTAYKTWTSCRTSQFSHRDEAWVAAGTANVHLNCCEAARYVPFVVGRGEQRQLVGGSRGRQQQHRVRMDTLLARG